MSFNLSDWFASTPLSGGNAAFVEDLYERFLTDPESVPPEWRSYFRAFTTPQDDGARDVPHGPVLAEFAARAGRASARRRSRPAAKRPPSRGSSRAWSRCTPTAATWSRASTRSVS